MAKHRTSPAPPLTSHCVAQDIPARLTLHHLASERAWTDSRPDPDLIFCRKQPGVAIGRLCEKCDGKCVICDSYVRPCTLVRICDECNYGTYQVPLQTK